MHLQRFLCSILLLTGSVRAEVRPAQNEADLRQWLQIMVWHHHFSLEEIAGVTGQKPEEITAALKRWDIRPETAPARPAGAPLLMVPYPGGRHPRIGFLEGAVEPQRETKLSVFTPWNSASYVVLDAPEALWSQLGLTYLAHQHVPTIWDQQKILLPRREWQAGPAGSYTSRRDLPNGISFGVTAVPHPEHIDLRLWLKNGTTEPLSKLKVQMCAMLKGVAGFTDQTNDNKIFRAPFSCARDAEGMRWIIHAWQPCDRAWGNAPCPCLHSDPQIPDCPPGEMREVRGWLSFYVGSDLEGELKRIEHAWTAHAAPSRTSPSVQPPPPFPGTKTNWNGYDKFEFEVGGKMGLVVCPKTPAPGHPWVWHGEFFGHKPAPDIALLGQGFHIAYLSVPDMLGSPGAVAYWNSFYAELTGKYQLSKKPALVGLSRGGLYVYNWATANPDKVSCIYADAPVCDFKSWPGGKYRAKGDPKNWQLILQLYHFKNDAEAMAYDRNPVDSLEPLAKAGVPLLHVYGDADEVVPWMENTAVLADRYQRLGGSITLIPKPGVGHHPHGLEDSSPIVKFIASHAAAPAPQ